MARDVRDEELEAEEPRRDVEFTLGPAMVLAIVSGLLLLCGLCFGVGYTSGRRSAMRLGGAAIKVAASGQTLTPQADNTVHKPAPTGAPPTVQAATSVSAPDQTAANSATPAAGATSASAGDSEVRPAMTPQSTSAVPAANAPLQVQPALAAGAGLMVQVAAVSHSEDANVLMAALRKRGYTVTARRESDDSLIHVQIGPFANRADANAMSQRLLNDGYNAVVLP
jgi:cell division septation protein DedD